MTDSKKSLLSDKNGNCRHCILSLYKIFVLICGVQQRIFVLYSIMKYNDFIVHYN